MPFPAVIQSRIPRPFPEKRHYFDLLYGTLPDLPCLQSRYLVDIRPFSSVCWLAAMRQALLPHPWCLLLHGVETDVLPDELSALACEG